METTPKEILIINEAKKLGFTSCAIVKIDEIDTKNFSIFSEWLNKGYAADMNYMYNNKEKRCNPKLLVESSKSMIIVSINYFPEKKLD